MLTSRSWASVPRSWTSFKMHPTLYESQETHETYPETLFEIAELESGRPTTLPLIPAITFSTDCGSDPEHKSVQRSTEDFKDHLPNELSVLTFGKRVFYTDEMWKNHGVVVASMIMATRDAIFNWKLQICDWSGLIISAISKMFFPGAVNSSTALHHNSANRKSKKSIRYVL